MPEEIKPLTWQLEHVKAVEKSLRLSRVYVDTSSTGAGKTIISLLVAKRLKCPVVLIVTTSVIDYWQEWANRIGVEVIACINYELLISQTKVTRYIYDDPPRKPETAKQKRSRLRTAKLWRKGIHPPESRKVQRKTLNLKSHPGADDLLGGWEVVNQQWMWNHENFEGGDRDPLFIFDEAHKLGGISSKFAHLLKATKDQDIRTLCLSATIADSPLRMRAIGYRLSLFKSWSSRKFSAWCELNGCDRLDHNTLTFTGDETDIAKIKGEIGDRMGGINTNEVPGFPASNLVLLSVPIDTTKLLDERAKALREMEEEAETAAVAAIRVRQLSEWLKKDWVLSHTRDLIDEGNSVVIFVSFKASGEWLAEKLSCDFISGETKGERSNQIRRFQANEQHAIVVMCQAGGESISLHDLHGRPRATIVMPNHKATEFVQVLGRTPRAGSQQSSVTQYIVFARGCEAEGQVRRNLRVKSGNIQTLTDNDLSIFPKKISKIPLRN